MDTDLLGAWSAALAVWLLGGAALCAVRTCDLWDESGARERILMIGIVLATAGWGYHQAYATYAWANDVFGWSFQGGHAFAYRALMTVGVLFLGGAMSWARCHHRGWLGLLLVGLVAGGVAVAVS
jgi:hypothetical protein